MENLLKEVRGNIYGMGIYCLRDENIVYYVGSGQMNDRLSSHLYSCKRGLYEGTNKDIIQKIYNQGELIFEVLHLSENNNTYLNGTKEEREVIQQSLETLEQFYYEIYKESVCNKMSKISKWSTSPTPETTWKRRQANLGKNNPNAKYDETLISNILFLKEKGLKPKEIVEMLLEHDINVRQGYISQIGVEKWIYLKSQKPDWYNEVPK